MSQIHAAALTTYDVDPSGEYVRIHVRDDAGRPASLVLPSECANQLLMSLPAMIQKALRNSYGDDSLRLVHSMKGFRIELGERSADGNSQLILTLETGDGFTVSFVASDEAMTKLARSIFHSEVDAVPFLDGPPRPC